MQPSRRSSRVASRWRETVTETATDTTGNPRRSDSPQEPFREHRKERRRQQQGTSRDQVDNDYGYFDNNENENDNDDETVIVYKESTSEEPSWALSQHSVNSARTTTETKPRDLEWQKQQQKAVSHIVSRKRQRKSRSRGASRRGSNDLLAGCYDRDYDCDDGETGHPVDDGFASLRSMMNPTEQGGSDGERAAEPRPRREKQDSPETQPCFGHNEPPEMDTAVGVEVGVEVEVESVNRSIEESMPLPKPKSNPTLQTEALCSPPDFDLCGPTNDDGDESDDESNRGNTGGSRGRTTKSKTPRRSLSTGRNRTVSRSETVSRHRTQSSSSSTSSLLTAGSGRKRGRSRNHPDPIDKPSRSRPRSRSTPGQNHSGAPRYRHTSVKVETHVENVKSLVGLRPTHWSRNAGTANSKRNQSDVQAVREQSCTQPLAKASALAAATRTPFHKLSNRNRYRTQTQHETKVGERISNPDQNRKRSRPDPSASSSSKPPATEKSPVPNQPSHSPRAATPTTAAKPTSTAKTIVSFAPSFVPTKSRVLLPEDNDDGIGDDEYDSGDGCRVVPAAKAARFSTPRQVRMQMHKSHRAAGEWVRALAALRNARSHDAVRLQNRALARSSIVIGIHDPRKKAGTVTDVTILGRYEGPWSNLPEDTKLTVLGYAHRHVRKRPLTRTQPTSRGDGPHTPAADTVPPSRAADTAPPSREPFFAWFTFTLATARRVELQSLCVLRIYNAVVLPCRFPATIDLATIPDARSVLGGENSVTLTDSEGGSETTTIRCETTVICTHLCERTK